MACEKGVRGDASEGGAPSGRRGATGFIWVVRLSLSELGQLVPKLEPQQRRLVCLFTEALLLKQQGRTDVSDRLRLVERTFDLSLYLMRRRAKRGELRAHHLAALDVEFGVSSKWLLHGDNRALADRIVAFCEGDPAG